MKITEMRKRDFLALRHRGWSEDIGEFQSLVIIPTRRKHDSGFMCMEFVAVDSNNEPICRLGGGSDVIHIDGIIAIATMKLGGWTIDCLPCGYLRLFNISGSKLKVGHDVSDFDVETA